MFQTFRENFRRHTLLRDAVFIVIGSAIVFNPGAFFQFAGYLIAGYLMLLGLINIYDDYKIKNKRVVGTWFRNRFNLCRLSSSLFIFCTGDCFDSAVFIRD